MIIKSTSSATYSDFINWLKTSREEKDLTLREAAVLIDKPHQYIWTIENGERRIDVYEYVQYCEILGFNLNAGLEILKSKSSRKVI